MGEYGLGMDWIGLDWIGYGLDMDWIGYGLDMDWIGYLFLVWNIFLFLRWHR